MVVWKGKPTGTVAQRMTWKGKPTETGRSGWPGKESQREQDAADGRLERKADGNSSAAEKKGAGHGTDFGRQP